MIDVLITTDLEFSIGGAFSDPKKYQPLNKEFVWLPQGDKSLGLGFILETLEQYNFPGVFFSETCNAAYHGPDEMGTIVSQLHKSGHDVQLHLHPGWMHFLKGSKWAKNDSCSGRQKKELNEIFTYSTRIFKDWLGYNPQAVRAGSLRVCSTFYEAIQQAGIPCSSSVGMPIFTPKETELHAYAGTTNINGTLEIPITTIVSNFARMNFIRPLQILSCSISEIIATLEYADLHKISPIVFLTHSFEYVRASDFRYSNYVKNPVTRERLKKTCHYLANNSDRFKVNTVSEFLSKKPIPIPKLYPPIIVPFHKSINRRIENRLSDALLDLQLKLS